MNRLIWDSWTRPICFTTVMMLAAGISLSQDKFTYTQNERIVKKTGLVAAMYSINSRTYVGSPEEIGRQFLVDNKAQFGFADVSEFKF